MQKLLLSTIAAVLFVGCGDRHVAFVEDRHPPAPNHIYGPWPTNTEISNWPILKAKTYNTKISPKSLNNRNPVRLLFQNNLNVDSEAIWFDFKGNAKSFGIIKAGKNMIINTFSTHPWLFKNANTEEIVGFYITPKYSARITLSGKTGEELKAEGNPVQ